MKSHARDEFEDFVRANAAGLLRTACLVVWDQAAAEDLVQECLFKVARRWPRVRTMEHPVAYARRILVNQALAGSERRSRHRAELELVPAAPEWLDESAERALRLVDTTAELTAALSLLTPRQRTVLALRYFEDLTEAQVAEILDCSVGTVKSTAWRALERLRQAVPDPVPAEAEPHVHAVGGCL